MLIHIALIGLQIAAAYPTCRGKPLPVSVAGRTEQVAIRSLDFEQTPKESSGKVVIRNDTGEPLRGVSVQVELLDEAGNLLAGFDTAAAVETVAGRDRLNVLSALFPGGNLYSHLWKSPLAPSDEAELDLTPFMILPSCPVTAAANVYATVDKHLRWRRVSDVVLRRSGMPDKFGAGREEEEAARLYHYLAGHGDVAVHLRVEVSGAATVIETSPSLPANELELLVKFFSARRFTPAIDDRGLRTDDLLILLRFGKERYHAAVPELPRHLAGFPLLRIGVSTEHFTTWGPFF